MRWQIAQYIFCDQQQTLSDAKTTQQLEPMAVELLSYFCRNPEQIISKEQLIEQVWLGRIVSDNAISKLITKLRKALADDVRKPEFIATFPKKGYKFIARATQLAPESPLNVADTPELAAVKPADVLQLPALKNHKFLWLLGLLVSALILIVVLVMVVNNKFGLTSAKHQQTAALTHAKAITRDAGDDLLPQVSPDGTRIAYMSAKNRQMHLLVKNIADERTIEISHEKNVGVGPASWSDDGSLLAYLVATPERCQYFIRTITELELGPAKLLHNCPAGSYGKIAFTHDNHRLIYSETNGGDSPYSLFEINLTTGKKKRLAQPELVLGGNSQFDLHPQENRLLISSPDQQQWEGFYSLDLTNNELQLLFKQDAYICCGIWSHDGKRVVLMGEHPAYQLLSYDLTGNDMQILYAGSQKLNRPIRHTNGKDYLFSSGQDNQNSRLMTLDDGKSRLIVDSSVDDRLAAFAHHSEQIAYIGLSSGNEELWLTDVNNNQRRKLSNFADSRHYLDLQWSPDGRFLMALTLNEIHLVNSQTGSFERLKIPQAEIRAVSFKDAQHLSYSIKTDKQWRVYNYNITNHSVKAADPQWQYIQYTRAPENTLWFDQQNKLYWGEKRQPVTQSELINQAPLYGRVFNLKKNGQQWLWFDYQASQNIIAYSLTSGKLTPLVQTDIGQFDIKNNQLLYGEIKRANVDIYQTQSSVKRQ